MPNKRFWRFRFRLREQLFKISESAVYKGDMAMTRFLVVAVVLTLLWISVLEAEADIAPDEREALVVIAERLGQKRWNFDVDPCLGKHGWNVTNDKDIENAINCSCSVGNDGACHVISIALKRQNLPGVLPPELVRLPFLQRIDLTANFLNGTIPKEWASMSSLQIISVGQNRLSGLIPPELGNISTLLELVLECNQFSGSIPPEIGKLVKLKRLIISSNNFSGELPAEIGDLPSLQHLRISDNNFKGKIPDFIENLTRLRSLLIHASGLEGPIPSGISHLANLTDLTIGDINSIESQFPPLDQMIKMRILILRNCSLSGPIPDFIGVTMKALKTLDLSFNKFTGSIPRNFENLNNTDFMFLTGNMLSGPVPAQLLSRVGSLDLSYNNYSWPGTCPYNTTKTNYFASSSARNNSNSSFPCSKDKFVCKSFHHSLYINCGGAEDVKVNGNTYEKDVQDPISAATYWQNENNNWVLSSTGNFLDNRDNDKYVVTPATQLSMSNPELYTTARSSPLSLTYYGKCLQNENYIVRLHFAEIVFTDINAYSSLGRRIFDIYIQGNLVWKDFNIEEEARGVGKETVKEFPVNVTHNSLEVRLYWAGKGTRLIPERGVYGPLISAISVVPSIDVSSVNKKTVFIVVGTLVPVFCILIFVVGILWRKCILGRKNKIVKDLRGFDLQTGFFTLRQIKAATNNFDNSNKIGEGGFGPVYKGLLSDGTIIAVKQLSSKSKQGNREFVNEIGMISTLQHPNLVKLHGWCIEGNQLILVYEYMENNSLARALFDSEEKQLKLDWPTRQRICVGIARGLAYLHEESRLKIVHRDIKATNVLLDKDLNPKISDFGLAKLFEEANTHISTRIAGTLGYMAPEYATRGYLTDKADVFSFGVVALEIVSGKRNTDCGKVEDHIYLLDWAHALQRKGSLLELIDPHLGNEFNKEEVMAMIKVALLCTNASSILRPSMSTVVSMLEGRCRVDEPTAPDTDLSNVDFELNSISQVDDDCNSSTQTMISSSSMSHHLFLISIQSI